ncbi:AAA family ATPase [Halobaculum sp. MBLA0143]|uniref:AAA family ATPase n=1 Tax=Halobaculum sp. MBLA0143 TaxID=3079933 RepID=UPI0035243DC0
MDPEIALLEAIGGIPESVETGDKYVDVVSSRLPVSKTRFYVYEGYNTNNEDRTSEKRGEEYSFDVRMSNQRTKPGDCDMIVVCGYLEGDDAGVSEDVFLLVDDRMIDQYGKVSGKPYTPNFYQRTIERAISHNIGVRSRSGKKVGRDGETTIVTPVDHLLRGLQIHANLPLVREYLHRKLPPDWRESPAKAQQIERVVEVFLTQESTEETAARRREAQEIIANQQGIEYDTVRQKCGSKLWHRESDSYQRELFDEALEEIEAEIELSTSPGAVAGSGDASRPTSETRVDHPDWTDPDHLPGPHVEADHLETDLFFPDQIQPDTPIVARIDAALRSGNHLVLTGPPGSGKTQLSKEICEHYRDDAYRVATATSDWSTFDTIGGYRQQRDGDDLQFTPGLFLERFRTDGDGVAVNEWLVVDELNRADVDKAFGSLFSVLTGETVTLPFSVEMSVDSELEERRVEVHGDPSEGAPTSPHRYYVPDDWRMIATMNSVDKASLFRMSYAFMRRLAFVSVPVPSAEDIDPDTVGEYLECWNINPEEYDTSEVSLDDGKTFGEKLREDLALIWTVGLKWGPEFGPGVIRDIVEHALAELQTSNSLGYDQALASHLLPQFEGQKDEAIRKLFEKLEENGADVPRTTLSEIEQPEDTAVSRQFAENYLGADLGARDD